MRNIALMPQRDILERCNGIAPDHARQPAELLGDDRVLLVRHGRTALLGLGKVLLRFPHLGALQVPHFDRDLLDRRGDVRQCGDEMGVTVPLDDLSGHGSCLQAKLAADALLRFRADVR